MPKDLFIEEIYALGCVFFAVMYEHALYPSDLAEKGIDEKLKARFKLLNRAEVAKKRLASCRYLPEEYDYRLKDIVHWMLHPESDQRPSIDKVCELLSV